MPTSGGHSNATARGCQGELVMVRAYNPTPAVLARIRRMIDEMPGRDVMVAFNLKHDHEDSAPGTGLKNVHLLEAYANHTFEDYFSPASSSASASAQPQPTPGSKAALEIFQREFKDRLAVYTYDMIVRRFPELAMPDPSTVFPGTIGPGGSVRPSFGEARQWGHHIYAWLFHDHCIQVALEQYQEQQGMRSDDFPYCGLWVVEDDVELSGEWGSFLDRYSTQNHADLVSAHACTTTNHWMVIMNDAFREHFKVEEAVRTHAEHLVYYSKPFLRAVKRQLQGGYHANSEIGTITFAEALGFERVEIPDFEFYGNTHMHSGPTEPHKCAEVMRRLRAEGEVKLYHKCCNSEPIFPRRDFPLHNS